MEAFQFRTCFVWLSSYMIIEIPAINIRDGRINCIVTAESRIFVIIVAGEETGDEMKEHSWQQPNTLSMKGLLRYVG